MTAYAAAERLGLSHELRAPNHEVPRSPRAAEASPASGAAVLEELLGRLADLVVERLAARSQAQQSDPVEEWLDTRRAADYLGVHRDTIRKLAAERTIPTHQDAPGCKLYFRRDELDEWRRSSRPTSRLRSVS